MRREVDDGRNRNMPRNRRKNRSKNMKRNWPRRRMSWNRMREMTISKSNCMRRRKKSCRKGVKR